MSSSFDHYHKWLAIPPENQPPNHYQLLALQVFESDPDVIEAAADQRMAHIRSYQSGKHRELSQQLLNELSAARIVLLDESRRAAYDEQLRHAGDIPSPAPQVVAATPLTQPFDLAGAPLDPLSQSNFGTGTRRLSSGDKRKTAPPPFPLLIALGAALIVVGSLVTLAVWRIGFAQRMASEEPSAEEAATREAKIGAPKPNAEEVAENDVREALETLWSDPNNPDANLVAGKYYCFERGHWGRGLAMLSKSNDDLFRDLASEDLSGKRDGAELGALWREAAERQPAPVRRKMLDRSAYWDVEALTSQPEPEQKAAIERVLQVAELNSEVGLGESIDLLALVDVDRHSERGEWIRRGSDISCPKGGSPLLFMPCKVRGSYRLDLTITQLGNDTILLALPAGFSQFIVNLHGYHGDLSEVLVRDKPIVRKRPGRLKLNERHAISVDVRLDGSQAFVTVTLNGSPHLACEMTMTSPDASVRHANAVKVGGSGRSHFTVHSARLTLSTGGLRYLKDEE